MNRRKFIKILSSVTLAGLCSNQFAHSQTKFGDNTLEVITDDGKLSKHAYNKIKNIRIPINTTVITFNTKRGRWESRIAKKGFLQPILKKDGRLVWMRRK